MTSLPIEVLTKGVEISGTIENVSIAKFDKETSEEMLSSLTSKLNGFCISKPTYFDFLIEKCVIDPDTLFKGVYDRPDYYKFIGSIITDICDINPFLDYNSMFVSSNGLLIHSKTGLSGIKRLVDNLDWNFPSLVFKYLHTTYIDINSIDFSKNFIVKHNAAEMFIVVKSLDEEDVNYLFKMKEVLSSFAYKKYFCYYSIYKFYYVYSCFVDFSGKDIPEVYDDLYRMVLSLNPSPFIERLLDDDAKNVEDDSNEESLGLQDLLMANNLLNNLPSLLMNQKPEKKKQGSIKRKQEAAFSLMSKKDIEALDIKLRENIFGQDEAIKALVSAVKRAKVGIRNADSPVLSAIFTGPTGVGKTECAKVLATELMKGKEAFIRIDCSEYGTSFEVSKLIGSPPGYVGHEEGGILVNKVIEYPFSVVLFDEIEKAHPKIYDILLQILDAGILTDSHGNTAKFNEAIIILTSNLASKEISTSTAPLGFGEKRVLPDAKNVRGMVGTALKKHFKPEFLGRIDEVVVFNSLDQATCEKIVLKELGIINEYLKLKGITIDFDSSVVSHVIKTGFNSEYGARPVIKTIKKTISDKVADALLESEDTKELKVSVDDAGEVIIGI